MPNGLPAEVTSFVGRRHELAEVKRLLSGSHVVTLTGVGGVGKSRLALRAAVDLRRAFPGGVWLVELAELSDPGLVEHAVADAIGLADYSRLPELDRLIERLAGRHALIVLDNCEHLLTSCAVLVDALVRSLPHLRVLVTSRQPLGIVSEQTVAVAPLPLPVADGSLSTAESLVECDAVQLFAERAAAVLPGFTVTEANQEAVAAICRRLDGLPLAIELAAVRLRALSAEQVLERLDDRFRLLTAGSRAAPPRQRTLRALIDWSYELCTPGERLLWQRASVFSGGLDLEAAEDVCSGDGIRTGEILDLVSGLVEKSVLVREEQPGSVRYRLLDTIRQYGRERLAASGRMADLQRRHRDHYCRLAARARAEIFSSSQVAWLADLQREHANLRTALEWSYGEPGEEGTGLAMAADLFYHWVTRAHVREGRVWLDQGLAAGAGPEETRVVALWAGAWLAMLQDDTESAAGMVEESRAIAQRLGLERALAYATTCSGAIAMRRGDQSAAIKLLREAADAHRVVGDPAGLALTLIRLCHAHSFMGDGALARSIGEESLVLCETHGDSWHRAYTLMALGVEAWREGDFARAVALEKDGLRFNRMINDIRGAGLNVEVLAWVAASEGRYERAARLLGALEVVWRSLGAQLPGFEHLARYHDQCRARCVEAMGDSAFRAATRRGFRLPYNDAILYALHEEDDQGKRRKQGAAERLAPLTRREAEIAELVARGLSNKDIASALVISQRTAEGHIEHILNKLGFNSRAQIAAWMSERTRED